MNFDLEGFLARAQQRLSTHAPDFDAYPASGDHKIEPSVTDYVKSQPTRPAAVLIPIVARSTGATLILTQRSQNLPSHAGQIAFPGGKVDKTDAGALAAALREANEEIGLDPLLVTPLGFLDVYQSGSGFRIAPVVAMVREPVDLTPEPGEVTEIFEVPLAFLMDPRHHEQHTGEWRGEKRRYYVMPYRERRIWGVTAGILRSLYETLYES